MKFSLSKHFTTASAFRTQRSLNALAVLLFVVALFPCVFMLKSMPKW